MKVVYFISFLVLVHACVLREQKEGESQHVVDGQIVDVDSLSQKGIQMHFLTLRPGALLEVDPVVEEQFVRITAGKGLIEMGLEKGVVDECREFDGAGALHIPVGRWFRVRNSGEEDLLFYQQVHRQLPKEQLYHD